MSQNGNPLNTDARDDDSEFDNEEHRGAAAGANPRPMNPMAQMHAAIMDMADQNIALTQRVDRMTAMFDTLMARMATTGPAPANQAGPAAPAAPAVQATATVNASSSGGAPSQHPATTQNPPGAQAPPPPAAISQQQPATGPLQQPQQLSIGINQRLQQQALGTTLQTQQQTLGTPPQMQQQQVAAARNQTATPLTPQHGLARSNGATASISQLVQHPPPPPPNPLGVATAFQQPPAAAFGHGSNVNALASAQYGTPPPARGPSNHNQIPTNATSNIPNRAVSLPHPGFPPGIIPQGHHNNRTNRSGTDSESAATGRSGRSTVRRRAEDRRHGHRDPSTEDESDEYAYNRGRPEIKNCKKIEICLFSPDNKELDFAIWVNQFEGAVNRCLNPHSRRRHHQACLIWLPSVLKADAYSIWSRAEHKTTIWASLRAELETAFEDGSVRTEWKTNLKAYTWDEENQTLHSYCAKVKSLVDNFETEMSDCPAARKAQYFLRFVNGLPEDYLEYIRLGLPPKCKDVDKARDVCMQFQAVKKLRVKNKAEVGASVSFQDPTVPSRITKNETDIVRLLNEIKHLREKPSDQAQTHQQGSTSSAGRSPYRQPNSASGPREQSNPRMEERINRFRNNRHRGNNSRGHRDGNYNQHRNQDSHSTSNQTSNQRSSSGKTSEMGAAAVTFAAAAGDGDLNDTFANYQAMRELEEEENYAVYCLAKDQIDSENC